VIDVQPELSGSIDLAALVTRAQRGDEAAFRALYREVNPGLVRYLRTLVGADAEDVASETWLQVSRDLPQFRDPRTFRGWAATIARHRALDHLRHERRRPSTPVPVEDLTAIPDLVDVGERAADSAATRSALDLIARLPRDQAEAVLLRVVVGLDAQTAGKVLGKRAGAVRTAAYRGLRRLAEWVAADPEGVGRSASGRRTPPQRRGCDTPGRTGA
jgi:RNA polymerase sigma-70 factor (ECF subfamily)